MLFYFFIQVPNELWLRILEFIVVRHTSLNCLPCGYTVPLDLLLCELRPNGDFSNKLHVVVARLPRVTGWQ
jgi:hypothetical protein